MFTFRELSLCRIIILHTSTGIHLPFSTYYYNGVIWFSQNAFLCARGLLCGFRDRLMLSHLYAEACFPIKSVWLPLSLLCVCAADCGRARVCAYILYARLWRDIERAPRGTSHQSPAREENLERQGGGWKRWRSPQEAAFGEMKRRGEKWLNGWSSP